MNLIFQNDEQLEIVLNNSVLRPVILKLFKHLQHVKIPFYDWDSPYYKNNCSWNELVLKMKEYGTLVGVEVDQSQLTEPNQNYLNHLHKIYEKNYNGKRDWLKFHEHIHLCEKYYICLPSTVSIDYRDLAGPLEKKFNFDWIKETSTKVHAGDVFIQWAELAKPPYEYWINQEPNNIDRLCELSKPWLIFKPKLKIALEDQDVLEGKHIDEFNSWWAKYEDLWCQHWQIPRWPIEFQYAQLIIGKITNWSRIIELLTNKVYPNRISLT
jgi:hypothetical protein